MQIGNAQAITSTPTNSTPRGSVVLTGLLSSLAVLWLACFLVPSAHGQYRTSIQGVVSDPTGAVIPGATLTLTNNGTNEKQVRTSDSNGVYNFNALPPDTFTLVVTRDGFQEKDLVSLQLNPEQANSINVQLTPGEVSQTVTVNASTEPAIDTETANTGRAITTNELQHMPVYQRDVTGLIRLAPGVLSDGAQQAGGTRAASLPPKMALRPMPMAVSLKPTATASTASVLQVQSGVERRSSPRAKIRSATSRSSRMPTMPRMVGSPAR